MTEQRTYTLYLDGVQLAETKPTPLELLEPLVGMYEKGWYEVSDYSIVCDQPGYFEAEVVAQGEEMLAALKRLKEYNDNRKDREEARTSLPDELSWLQKRIARHEAFRERHPILSRLRYARAELRAFWQNVLSPRSLYYRAKHARQRLRRGYSDRDVWSGDWYMLDVMIGVLERLRDLRTGTPSKDQQDYTPEDWKQYLVNGDYPFWDSDAWWDGPVLDILAAFKKYRTLHTGEGIPTVIVDDNCQRVDTEFREAGETFFRYFGAFWE